MRSQALRTHTLNMGLHVLKPRPKKVTPSSSRLEQLQNALNELSAMKMKLETEIQTERMRLLRHILGENGPEKEKTG
jgi:uncharacterized protein (DUF58 family)